jgi:hypothetical protein
MTRMAFPTARINAWLTLPLLFLMGAATRYPMFGRWRQNSGTKNLRRLRRASLQVDRVR